MDIVAIYGRLSDEDKNKINKGDDSESILNQKLMLTEYAIARGWHIYKIYDDDDYSGADITRPQWNELIKDAEAGKFPGRLEHRSQRAPAEPGSPSGTTESPATTSLCTATADTAAAKRPPAAG